MLIERHPERDLICPLCKINFDEKNPLEYIGYSRFTKAKYRYKHYYRCINCGLETTRLTLDKEGLNSFAMS
jgi:hypothetical protein